MKYKLLVMDVDGTLTDGKIYMGSSGEVFKAFDVKDGYAIRHILPELGIKSAIITGRESEIVKRRAEELKIDYLYQSVNNKEECLLEIVNSMNIEMEEVVYIGDDINDLGCIKSVNSYGGLSACPMNSIVHVKKEVGYICERNGGCGAVREIIDMIGGK